MRTLSATLLAAQKAASGVPYVRTVVSNSIRGLRHLVFAQTYSDGVQDDEHDAVADSTYLHRARVRAGRVQYQRNTGAAWGGASWTNISSATDSQVAAIDAINNTRVIIIYSRGAALYFRESTDQGATFTAELLIFTTGFTPKAITIAYKTNGGDLCAVWEENNKLRRVRRIAAAWGAAPDWTFTVASINGVDMLYYGGDFEIVLTGVELTTNRPTMWSVYLGDGFSVTVDVWASLFIQQQAESDESITFSAPHVARPDTTRLTFVEKFSGTPAYTRTYMTMLPLLASFSPAEWEWLDPAPLNNTTNFGYAIAWNATNVYYSRPAQVLAAPRAASTLDMSADLLDATVEEAGGLHQRAELVFDNSNGQYAGPPLPIALHRDVSIGLGYDANYSSPPLQYIESWEYRRDGGVSRFVLRTRGADLWLGRYGPRTTIVVANRKVTTILRGTAARAGLESLNTGNSARSNALNLAWTIHPHQDHLETIEALLAIMPDLIWTNGALAVLTLTEPLAGDATDYTYGTDHAIYRSRTRDEHAPSVAEVLGEGALGQAFDFAAINNDKPIEDRRRDPNETAAADANAAASARLRKAVLATDKGELVTPPNAGLEILDVVAYTDTLVNAAQRKARVTGITTKFRRTGPALFEQTVKLGGV